ncbi:MAG: anaerobic sulfatase-maturation protein [Bacteroidaceae bacterium]
MQKDTYSFSRQCYIMAKPVSAKCNLACHYCYYTEKEKLYSRVKNEEMTTEMLEEFTRQYIEMQTGDCVLFTWHGGEPLLRPLSFYKKAIEFQKKYAGGRHIDNSIQTNGTLLTPEWCKFLHNNKWLMGVSIDGPSELHDRFRLNRHGKSSFKRVMEGIDMLNYYNVEWNAMATVNSVNAKQPLDFYHFFKKIKCRFLQFTPVVERIMLHEDGRHLANADEEASYLAPFSVSPHDWGDFCCTIFDEWVRNDVGELYVQLFDTTLANWLGLTPGLCTLARDCGHAAAIEANGDLYCCDHFVFPQYKLGNIHEHSLIEMMYGPQQNSFATRKRHDLPTKCRQCRWLFACHGECPRNRFCKTDNGEPYLNYLCEGYQQFFSHVAPYMDTMANLYKQGLPPAEIMKMV